MFTCGLIDSQEYEEDILFAYGLCKSSKKGPVAVNLLHAEVSSRDDLRRTFEEAMASVEKASLLTAYQIIEMFKNTGRGFQRVGASSSTQTASHTPPLPSYDRTKHTKIHQVLVDESEPTLLTGEKFYFAFGRQTDTIYLGNTLDKAEQAKVLRGKMGEYHSRLVRSARASVALKLIKTILERNLSVGGKAGSASRVD